MEWCAGWSELEVTRRWDLTAGALGCTCRARYIRNVRNISAQLNSYGFGVVIVHHVDHVVMTKCSRLTEQVNGAAGEACKAEDATPTCTA